MARSITLPDGRTLSLTGNETPEQLAALKEKLRTKYKTAQTSTQEQSITDAADAFGWGAAQYTSLGFDPELRAAGKAAGSQIRSLFTGEEPMGYKKAYEQVTGALKKEQELNPTAYGVGEVTGAIGTAMATGPTTAARTFLGRIGQQAAAGAALEGVTGFGQADGDLYDRLKAGAKKAATGAVLSAGTGAALEGVGKVAKVAYGLALAPKSSQQAVKEAIDQGAPITAGQVLGGASGAMEGYAAQMASGDGLREIGEMQGKYLEGQAAGLFKNVKIPTSGEDAGESIVKGLSKSANRYRVRKNKLYERALKNVPETTAFIPQKSREIVNQIIAESGDNKELKKLIGAPEFDLIDKALSGDITLGQAKKSLKNRIWDLVTSYEKDQPGLSNKFKDIYFAIDEDIVNTANSVDPLAGQKMKVADQYMKSRMEMNEKLRTIFDPNKGANETAAKAYYKAVGMATDGRAANKETLLTLKKALPKEEFDEFRSFLFVNLGRETPGQAGLDAGVIPRSFLTSYNKLSQEAKNILLDGPQKQAMQKLAQYAETVSPVTLNKSGSGGAITDLSSAAAAVATGNAWFFAIPIGNYIYGKSYQTPAGKMLVKAINKLPREIMTSPPNQVVRNALRGQLLSMGATQSIIDEIDAQFEQSTGE